VKKYLSALLAGACGVLVASAAMAFTGSYSPDTGVNNTVHDLSQTTNGMVYSAQPADTLNRICIFCHAPHNTYRLSTATGGAGPQASAVYDYLPLWNHELADDPQYTMYENGPGAPQSGHQASQAIEEVMVPGSTSLLCLSCHDGSIAPNSYGNASQLSRSQSGGGVMMSNQYVIGLDAYLGNHHPIGFSYQNVADGDTEIRDADSAFLTAATSVRDHLYGFAGTMECGTCHSVHNKGNSGETLLWRSDQNSELCLTCHDKGIYTDF